MPGESAYILDAAGEPAPPGVPGDLCIGGAGLALGYLNLPVLTAETFVDNPVEPGARIYRTGDCARWLADGTIGFMGRRDRQLKVRGFRVELGEIEAALRQLSEVAEAAVVERQAQAGTELVAFAVAVFGASVPANPVHALAAILPKPMIPARIIPLDRIPVTSSGKIDYTALRALPSFADAYAEGAEPGTTTELRLAALWRRVLGAVRVGLRDDFFAVGGHSLLAVRLAGLIHAEFGIDLPISVLFEAPDIARQARFLDSATCHRQPLLQLQPAGEGAPWQAGIDSPSRPVSSA